MQTAEILLDELIAAADDLLQYDKHDDSCTNEAQKRLLPKIVKCRKCEKALEARELRFRRAVDQVKLLRDVFGVSTV